MRDLGAEGGISMKVLLADDDLDFVLLLKTFLEAHGWEIIVAHDALQAGMLVRRDEPSVVLLDLNMPGGSGIRALKQLKASPKFGRIPVVVVSARADDQLPRTTSELGASAFVRKPVILADLHHRSIRRTAAPGWCTRQATRFADSPYQLALRSSRVSRWMRY
jgi:chemosensory pili system protein ChpA (sensor histidine kinase/response regulator)